MRILFVSNLYPPHFIGGYELRCRNVVEGLRAKGHVVRVLTSTYGVTGPRIEGYVARLLPQRWRKFETSQPFAGQLASEVWAQFCLRREILRFKPEIVSLWNMWSLSSAIVRAARRSGRTVTFHIDDEWMTWRDPWLQRWTGYDRPWQRAVKRALRAWIDHRQATDLDAGEARTWAFVSRFRRDEYEHKGWPVSASPVLYGGVSEAFAGRRFECFAKTRPPRGLLFSGTVARRKAPHLAVEALKRLHGWGFTDATLKIVGSARGCEQYLGDLRRQVTTSGLDGSVEFVGPVPPEAMPRVYQDSDILLFTSSESEGFPLTVLEAMAGGLAVVGSLSGGQQEILRDGCNGMTFTPGDIDGLARKTRLLMESPETAIKVAEAAHRIVCSDFTLERMVNQHEEFFTRIVEEQRQGGTAISSFRG